MVLCYLAFNLDVFILFTVAALGFRLLFGPRKEKDSI